jgi:molybdenum cofactor cytidylyltransferase
MIFAVIPAAGKSKRMGRPKLTLPLGNRTVLDHVIAALHVGGVDTVLVVAGPHVSELVALVERAGASALLLADETADMRTTVERGLDWLERRLQPKGDDAWFLAPADHPLIGPDVVRELIQARDADREHSIFVPVARGRRGHPTLLAWNHVAGIRQLGAGEGLNQYVRRHAADIREVPMASDAILRDVDTPEDYHVLRAEYDGET